MTLDEMIENLSQEKGSLYTYFGNIRPDIHPDTSQGIIILDMSRRTPLPDFIQQAQSLSLKGYGDKQVFYHGKILQTKSMCKKRLYYLPVRLFKKLPSIASMVPVSGWNGYFFEEAKNKGIHIPSFSKVIDSH